jgi:UDP-GlcNAc:undecaprenyl-phosphate/decaprenyl-phosphate GlcNAc-1-phosphate transferase
MKSFGSSGKRSFPFIGLVLGGSLLGSTAFAPLGIALLLSVLLTPIVRTLAISKGMVAHPKTDRWHSKPTALLGGISIAMSVALCWLVFADRLPTTQQGLMVLGGSLFLGVVGFVDDIKHIKPYQKLICQLLAAALVISADLTLPWTMSPSINVAITFFWLVGITNAVNLLDNMDGLAAGVSATAAIFLAINLALNGQPQEALMLGVLAATLVGFLFYNSKPASVFMGDTGSMFIGFFLASAALLSATGARSRSFLVVIAVPVLVLFIPIFDTTLVTILRKVAGRPASQGGRDHTSHRLVALGLSEVRAVWLLYGLAIVSGMIAVAVNHLDWRAGLAVMSGFGVILTLLGIYLGGVRVYDEAEAAAARQRPMIAFIVDISYKRRLFEVLLDLVLILLAFYSVGAILPDPVRSSPEWLQPEVIAVVVFAQMLSLFVTGSYRGIWRYVGIDDLIVYAKGAVAGAVLTYVALRFVVRLDQLPPSVFVLNAVLLFIMLAASRLAFRLFRRLLLNRTTAENSKRALIFGAGDGGEILLRELHNNRELGLVPVGFVDDDPLKAGKRMHGLPVHLATPSAMLSVCHAQKAEEVVVSTSKLTDKRIEEITHVLTAAGIVVRRMRIQLDIVAPAEAAEAEATVRRQKFELDVPSIPEVRRRRDSKPMRAL